MADKQKILDRIAKLFRLGDANRNSSEAEVMLAVTKAQELMAEHHISMADLDMLGDSQEATEIKIKIATQVAYVRKGVAFAAYDDYIAHTVSEICEVTVFDQRRWGREGRTIARCFAGTEADTAVAAQLFIILLKQGRRMARSQYGSGWSQSHTSYMLGLGKRLYHRACTELKLSTEQTQALVLWRSAKDNALAQWMANERIRETSVNDKRYEAKDRYAQSLGWHDGEQVNLGKRGLE